MRLHPAVHLQSLLDVQCVLAMFLLATFTIEAPQALGYDPPPLVPGMPLAEEPPLVVHLGIDALGVGRIGIATRCRADDAWGWLDAKLRSDLRSRPASRVLRIDVEDGVRLDDVIRAMDAGSAGGYEIVLGGGWPRWTSGCAPAPAGSGRGGDARQSAHTR